MTSWNISNSLTITEPGVGTPGSIALTDTAGTSAVTLSANSTTAAYTLTMPAIVSTAGDVLTATDTVGSTLWTAPSPVFSVWYFKDVKATGVNAGTFTSGSWVTRTLNTTEKAVGVGTEASLSGNAISLFPGVWLIEAKSPAHEVNLNAIRIQNTTTATTLVVGTAGNANNGLGTTAGTFHSSSNAQVVYTIASGTELIEIQQQCQSTKAGSGLGLAANLAANEVYTIVTVIKIG